ncbi:MAG: GTP-binding protein [Nitrososphaeria archaeon]
MIFGSENDEGNVEYKLKLTSIDSDRIDELATQLNYRLNEGGGEAFYELGVTDEGELLGLEPSEAEISFKNFDRVCKAINVFYSVIRCVEGKKGKVYELLVRRMAEALPISVSVVLVGNADAGKSTIKGTLVYGVLDDGNGLAMSKVVRYIHEIRMRRTSAVNTHILGFDLQGKDVNSALVNYNESEIYLKSSKIVNLIDLAGHEKYLKTTLRGILGNLPDYSLLVVSANSGIVGTFKEHLGISLALKIPVIICVTKIDLAPENRLRDTLDDIIRVLKLPGINQIPHIVKSKDDIVLAARHIRSGRIVPIFQVSNLKGDGLQELKKFFNILPPRIRWRENLERPFKLYVDEIFNVTGVGSVVSGLVEEGAVSVEDEVVIGPFEDQREPFKKVRVKGIQINRMFVNRAFAGQSATFAIPDIRYDKIRKGLVLLDKKTTPKPVIRFRADVKILHHPTTMRIGYSPVIHSHTIRQTARTVQMSKEVLRTGDVAEVTFEFIVRPEYIERGQTFVFREGRTRGIGTVLETYSE